MTPWTEAHASIRLALRLPQRVARGTCATLLTACAEPAWAGAARVCATSTPASEALFASRSPSTSVAKLQFACTWLLQGRGGLVRVVGAAIELRSN